MLFEYDQQRRISIHALREEGDLALPAALRNHLVISIHALREEGDTGCASNNSPGGISIHALREEGDAGWRYGCSPADISIHALREEGDFWSKSV